MNDAKPHTGTSSQNPDYSSDLRNAVQTLRDGGVLLYPTDTVWGLGCDATNAEAVRRVFEIKSRKPEKSCIVLVGDIAALERLVGEIPDAAEQLLEAAVEPLTIIYDHAPGLAPGVAAEDGSAAVRVTSERFSRDLCRRLGKPILSTSANISGAKTPKNFSQISPDVIDKVDYTVFYRRNDMAQPSPSAIIKVANNNVIKIIR